jgi:hypothetical protein
VVAIPGLLEHLQSRILKKSEGEERNIEIEGIAGVAHLRVIPNLILVLVPIPIQKTIARGEESTRGSIMVDDDAVSSGENVISLQIWFMMMKYFNMTVFHANFIFTGNILNAD